MPSFPALSALGFVSSTNLGNQVKSHGHSKPFNRCATNLWQAFNFNDAVPEFDPNNMGPLPKPHSRLQSNVSKLQILPNWSKTGNDRSDEALFNKLITKHKFSNALVGARILAKEIHSVWGDSDALSLLQLAGRETVLSAYDHGNFDALTRCAVAFTVIEADHAIRQTVGAPIHEDLSAVDHYTGLKILGQRAFEEGRPAVFEQNNAAGGTELHVQPQHPNYTPALVLDTIAKSYQNQALLSVCGIHEIAKLLKEPMDQNHLEIYYALADSPRFAVCDQINPLPEPDYLIVNSERCANAYEQCRRHFGDSFMGRALFGNLPGPVSIEQAKYNLELIVPEMNRFIKGDSVDWC